MSETNVRPPASEPADPFGDAPWADLPPRPADPYGDAPSPPPAPARPAPKPPEIEVPLGFEPEPAPRAFGSFEPADSPALDLETDSAPRGSNLGGTLGGFLAVGAARVVVGLIILAFTTGGFGLFVDLSNDGPPNVPQHILDACHEARLDHELGASIGRHISYEQGSGDQIVTFRTPSDTEWVCRWNSAARTAIVDG